MVPGGRGLAGRGWRPMKSKSIESSLHRQGVFILHVAILNSRLNAVNANRAELFKIKAFTV